MSERIILSKNCIYSSDCNKTGVNNNCLVVGGPGSGKSFSLLMPLLVETLREKQRSLIVVCTKRKIPDMFIPLFKSAGFNTYDMNFSDPMASDCMYDPMYYLASEEDVSETARAIVMANEQKKYTTADPFWDMASIQLLTAYIMEILMLHPDSLNATFKDVIDLHNNLVIEDYASGITTSLDQAFAFLKKERPDCYALKCWRSFREAAPKTARSTYVTLSSTLSAFTTDICKAMDEKPNIDFEKNSSQPSVVFVTTSPVNKSLHSLANMFAAQCIKSLFEIAEEQPDGVLPIPVHIAFDDFATGSIIADFPEKISIFREKGISCTLLLQSESQLEKLYGRCGATEIIDGCDSYVYLGSNNVETARSISVRLDVPLSEVLYMPVGQEIVFRRGQLPVITQRYNITDDLLYQKAQKLYDKRKKGRAK